MQALSVTRKKKAVSKLGVLASSGVAFMQGLDGFLFAFFGLIASVAAVMTTAEFSIAVILIKETITLLIFLIIFFPKIKNTITKLRSRSGAILVISALGTTLGNFFYIFGIALASSSYGMILTSLYPIFSVVLLRIFYKEKQPTKVWLPIVLTFISGLLFLLLPTLVDYKDSGEFDLKRLLGMLLGLLAALAWALELVLIRKGREIKNTFDYTTLDVAIIRTLAVCLFSFIILLPISFSFGNTKNTIQLIGAIFSSWQGILMMFSFGGLTVVLRLIHTYSIHIVGIKLASIIDNNNFWVPALLSVFFSYANWHNVSTGETLIVTLEWWVWLLLIPLLIGTFLVLYFEKIPEEDAITGITRIN